MRFGRLVRHRATYGVVAAGLEEPATCGDHGGVVAAGGSPAGEQADVALAGDVEGVALRAPNRSVVRVKRTLADGAAQQSQKPFVECPRK